MPNAPALVIVCGLTPSRRSELLREAKMVGLDADGLVLTGYIPDGVMRAVIEGAAATIFPSLYEGLGLPVLESYQYGRPALVSDNSSLKELAPAKCRFDARRPESIAEAVIRFHRDPTIAQASLDCAPGILKMCGWKAAADVVAGWFAAESTQPDLKEPLGVITSLPPDESGVAIYMQKTLASAPWAIRFYAPWADERLGQAVESMRRVRHVQRSIALMPRILPISDYRPTQRSAIWVLGNSEHHIETIDMLVRAGQSQDFIYLHEADLDGLLYAYHLSKGKRSGLPKKIQNLNDLLGVIRPRNILVNSEFCSQLVQSLPNATEYKVQELFLPILDVVPPRAPQAPKPTEQPLVIMHIGFLADSKQPDKIIRACEQIRRNRPVKLIFAGYDVAKYCLFHALDRPWIEMQEGLSDEELVALMQKADVGIQLRWPQHGESSGALCQWLGLRKPVIATAGGSFNEFAGAAWLVPPEAGPEELAKAIMRAAELGTPKNLDDFIATRTITAWQTAFQNILALQTAG